MESRKTPNTPLEEIAQKYETILRARMDKLRQWGATSEEIKEIYKAALQNLRGLDEKSTPQDKAAAIEKAVVDTLGPTKYEVYTTQSRLKEKVKFRIKNVIESDDQV